MHSKIPMNIIIISPPPPPGQNASLKAQQSPWKSVYMYIRIEDDTALTTVWKNNGVKFTKKDRVHAMWVGEWVWLSKETLCCGEIPEL